MSRRISLPAALLGLAALALTACQTVSVPPAPPMAWSVRRPELQSLGTFHLTGRVAVAVEQRGFDANIRWAQNGTRTRMILSGPLGADAAQVTADGASLSVITPHGRHLGNAAAREVLVRQLGFEPPLQSLRYWVLGVPDPGTPASVVLDAEQRPTRLRQGGWSIEYHSYMPVGADWLPRLLTVRRAGVRLRMVVDAWRLQ
jgi:outer membrane lipoprotein LolB